MNRPRGKGLRGFFMATRRAGRRENVPGIDFAGRLYYGYL